MSQIKLTRSTLATALFAIVLGGSSLAAAETGNGTETRHHCDGKQGASTPEERAQRQAERFQKADKNGDGFLTADEVGEKRWAHIKVADANGDGKVSKAELEQAHKDGKLGHRQGGNSKTS
jgi:Ca2+-binding EF-hand superfamily protein